jgi:hypothetical protein
MKRVAAIAGLLLGLMAGQTAANPLPLEGRDINGNPVGATDASAVFEYDPNLNMTWLRDWNYAYTSGYASIHAGGSGTNTVNSNGSMGWDAANVWTKNLVVGGYSGWNLPVITDTGTAGCNNAEVGTDCGYNVYGYGTNSPQAATLSPMAYLWYVELGNKAYHDTSGHVQSGWGLTNTGPFINMQSYYYWSSTKYGTEYSGSASNFYTYDGFQGSLNRDFASFAAAVRDGDVCTKSCFTTPPPTPSPAPAPATIVLLVLGIVGIGVTRRRRSLPFVSRGLE